MVLHETLHVRFTRGASIRRSMLPLGSLESPGDANFPWSPPTEYSCAIRLADHLVTPFQFQSQCRLQVDGRTRHERTVQNWTPLCSSVYNLQKKEKFLDDEKETKLHFALASSHGEPFYFTRVLK